MFYKIAVNSWKDTLSLFEIITDKVSDWAFRGQSDEAWNLSTKFQREAEKNQCNEPYWFNNREYYILWDFQRRAHHYVQNLPKLDNNIEWLSLLQHHGGPTRLLDFTYSFYVALFFAVEISSVDSAVWAVNIRQLFNQLDEKMDHTLTKNIISYDKITEKNIEWAETVINDRSNKDVVFLIEPFILHERISIQQGIFLFPGNIERPFEYNLCSAFKFDFQNLSNKNALTIEFSEIDDFDFSEASVLKIIIPFNIRTKTLLELRNMNITSATLFPGLDGFARSLSYRFSELDHITNRNSSK